MLWDSGKLDQAAKARVLREKLAEKQGELEALEAVVKEKLAG